MRTLLFLSITLFLSPPLHAELFTEHFENGIIKSEIEYVKGTRSDTQKGIKEGLEKVYYSGGELAFSLSNTEGKREGKMHWYDEEGKHLEVMPYKQGLRHGLNSIFYASGLKRIEVNYINDHKEGKETYFFDTGTLASEVLFVHGRKEGIQKEYNLNGTLNNTVTYKQGYKEGEKKWYDEKGIVIRSERYKKDRPLRLMKKLKEKHKNTTIEAFNVLDFDPNNRKVE